MSYLSDVVFSLMKNVPNNSIRKAKYNGEIVGFRLTRFHIPFGDERNLSEKIDITSDILKQDKKLYDACMKASFNNPPVVIELRNGEGIIVEDLEDKESRFKEASTIDEAREYLNRFADNQDYVDSIGALLCIGRQKSESTGNMLYTILGNNRTSYASVESTKFSLSEEDCLCLLNNNIPIQNLSIKSNGALEYKRYTTPYNTLVKGLTELRKKYKNNKAGVTADLYAYKDAIKKVPALYDCYKICTSTVFKKEYTRIDGVSFLSCIDAPAPEGFSELGVYRVLEFVLRDAKVLQQLWTDLSLIYNPITHSTLTDKQKGLIALFLMVYVWETTTTNNPKRVAAIKESLDSTIDDINRSYLSLDQARYNYLIKEGNKYISNILVCDCGYVNDTTPNTAMGIFLKDYLTEDILLGYNRIINLAAIGQGTINAVAGDIEEYFKNMNYCSLVEMYEFIHGYCYMSTRLKFQEFKYEYPIPTQNWQVVKNRTTVEKIFRWKQKDYHAVCDEKITFKTLANGDLNLDDAEAQLKQLLEFKRLNIKWSKIKSEIRDTCKYTLQSTINNGAGMDTYSFDELTKLYPNLDELDKYISDWDPNFKVEATQDGEITVTNSIDEQTIKQNILNRVDEVYRNKDINKIKYFISGQDINIDIPVGYSKTNVLCINFELSRQSNGLLSKYHTISVKASGLANERIYSPDTNLQGYFDEFKNCSNILEKAVEMYEDYIQELKEKAAADNKNELFSEEIRKTFDSIKPKIKEVLKEARGRTYTDNIPDEDLLLTKFIEEPLVLGTTQDSFGVDTFTTYQVYSVLYEQEMEQKTEQE